MSSAEEQRPPAAKRSVLLSEYMASSDWDSILDDPAQHQKPWRKLGLAFFLMMMGAVLLITGIVQWYQSDKSDKWVSMIVLGCICFLPGFYHMHIAYMAWRGVQGYSLNQIPDF